MRSHILTEHERKLIQTFLEKEIRDGGFKVLLHRIRKDYSILKEDIKLLSKVLEKTEKMEK